MGFWTVTVEEGGLTRRVPAGTIYALARTYAEHAAELNNPVPGEPVVFLKATSSLRAVEDAGTLAFPEETFHHEAEIVLLVGKPVARGEDPGWSAVRAVGLGLDLTRREVQSKLKEKGLPWTASKSFEGASVVTPLLPVGSFAAPDAIAFELEVGGAVRQRGDSRELLFKVPAILRFLATLGPLAPGDLIFTGTPKGVGPIERGDTFTLRFKDPARAWTGTL